MAQQIFEDNLVRKGGNKKGFLKAKNKVSDPDKLREAWRNLYSNNSENVMVLNEGMDFQESSSTSVEMQLNENKQTNGTEICKLFGIPPSILLGGATEQDKVNYVDMIVDLLTAIETSLDRDFLLEREKAEMYWAFDTKELTRGSIRERFSAYASALQNNIMQVDEVRELEDLPPTGFHYFKLGLQDVLLDQNTGLIYTPNTNAWAKMNQKALKNPEDSGTMEPRANPYHDEKGRFASAGSDILLPDIQIGRSVGAKFKNYDIELPNKEIVHLEEGSRITNIQLIAGKGRNRQIDELPVLLEKFPGSKASEWTKKKGIGFVVFKGENYKVELHWYEEPSAGKVKWKVKSDASGNWFIDDD